MLLYINVLLYINSTFNFKDESRELSGIHWQQIIEMGLVRKHPITYTWREKRSELALNWLLSGDLLKSHTCFVTSRSNTLI